MISLLKRIVSWLETRFPEKLVLKAEDYMASLAKAAAHDVELSGLRSEAQIVKNDVEVLVARIGALESKAAHVEAVRDVVLALKKLQDEYSSLKTSLGMNKVPRSPDAAAYLNDEPIGGFNGEF
jgi:hypothetical protein